MPLPTLQELQSDLAAAIRDRDDYSDQARVQRGAAAEQECQRLRQPFLVAAAQLERMSFGQARQVVRLQAEIAEHYSVPSQLERVMLGQRAHLSADQQSAVDETFGHVARAA